MARSKRSKTKRYYARTTTLKRTGVTQYDRDAVVELSAEGWYNPLEFCDIARQFKFSSCRSFRQAVDKKQRRMAAEARVKQRKLEKRLEAEPEWTFDRP